MKMKIIMNSGKEYATSKFKSMDEFLEKMHGGGATVNYLSVDKEKKIWIDSNKVSSFEILDES
ncbi:hypothetical protein [Indiicoccus explosivorum]|uniref:hypothetical protein n=1 Tax=Indiicoccus explosivorum TaxID=1917864 RepID=UPI000B44C4C5|nr:hypothetical protein [Indiicoccus explosivorum]